MIRLAALNCPIQLSSRGRRIAAACIALIVALAGCSEWNVGREDVGIVYVAVAANFADAASELARVFEAETAYQVVTSTGSTGQLYAQIVNGAPFEVFLSADAERPRLLEEAGLAVPGSRFTYAVGRLALYGPGLDSVRAGGADLVGDGYTHVAIADPAAAPYGAAAMEVLAALGLESAVRPRIVQGESIAQTYQFVGTGAAELGFVALSQVVREPERSYWLVPREMHAPILQDVVLLRGAEGDEAARAFLDFLRSPAAREIIQSHGYDAAGEGSQ